MTYEQAVAQLRHLYQQLIDGVGNPEDAARGLLGPAIAALENLLNNAEAENKRLREIGHRMMCAALELRRKAGCTEDECYRDDNGCVCGKESAYWQSQQSEWDWVATLDTKE